MTDEEAIRAATTMDEAATALRLCNDALERVRALAERWAGAPRSEWLYEGAAGRELLAALKGREDGRRTRPRRDDPARLPDVWPEMVHYKASVNAKIECGDCGPDEGTTDAPSHVTCAACRAAMTWWHQKGDPA